MDRYGKTKKFILDKLKAELPETLYYHGFHHVLDVLGAAELLGKKENISEKEMELLRVAVLFHDSGKFSKFSYLFYAHCSRIKKSKEGRTPEQNSGNVEGKLRERDEGRRDEGRGASEKKFS